MARVLAEKINQPRNSISLSAPIAVSLLVLIAIKPIIDPR